MVVMRRLHILPLVAILFAACTDISIHELSSSDIERRIYATIADAGGGDTRVELNERLQTVWNESDEILTFSNEEAALWRFDGLTGDREGNFIYEASLGALDSRANFDKYYAIHLPLMTYYWESDGSPLFYTTIPSTQSYKRGSYGTDTNAMFGTSDDGKSYEFKNIFGYLRLSITGGKIVQSITISGNNEEFIAGDVILNKEGELTNWRDNLSTSITIDCGDGVQLSDIPTYFYITVPPITLAEGISVKVYFTDGTVFPKSTSKSISLYRNTIQPMASFDTGGSVEWQTITIKHSGTKVSAPTLYGASALTGYIYWGDDYMSDVNRTESYVYDDGEPMHTITIKALNATTVEITDCSGISEIDLSNF